MRLFTIDPQNDLGPVFSSIKYCEKAIKQKVINKQSTVVVIRSLNSKLSSALQIL